MSHVPTRLAAVASALGAALVLAPAAHAADVPRTSSVTTEPGVTLKVNFFPAAGLAAGQQAPTVLQGPGWGSAGDTDPDSPGSPGNGVTGVGALREAGYNVLTWDPRGFHASTGQVNVDGPEQEGRDTQRLVDFVARQPEAQLDGADDPRVGMTGGSYGGGIQTVTASQDPRIDALVPAISWHSLQTSLYKDEAYKAGFASLLLAAGNATGVLNPTINAAGASATTTGSLSPEQRDFFVSRGPGDAVSRITAPTLIFQGTQDILFTLQEAATNYTALREAGTPVKMVWFCGGHSGCSDAPGDTGLVDRETLAWLARYLKGDTSVDTGPGFTFVDQQGTEHTTNAFPAAAGTPIEAEGSGTLPLLPTGGAGASPTGVSPATNAVDVAIPVAQDAQLAAAPQLELTYRSQAAVPTGNDHVFAQVVDVTTGKVLNNAITPIPVTLDGQEHTVARPLEVLSAHLPRGEQVELQVVASPGAAYLPQRAVGSLQVERAKVTLPTVDLSRPAPELPATGGDGSPAGGGGTSTTTTTGTTATTPAVPVQPAPGPAAQATPGAARPTVTSTPCTSRRAVTLHVKRAYRSRVRSARVLVAGKRVATFRSARAGARISFAQRRPGTVRATIVMRLRDGRTVRDVRTFRLCVPASLAARAGK